MKNRIKYMIALFFGVTLFGCEHKLEPYNSAENRIVFNYIKDKYNKVSDSLQRYTFVYDDASVKEYVMNIEVITMGFITNYDRVIALKQIPTGNGLEDAIPETDFVPLNDPSMVQKLVVKAGQNSVKIPITFKRDPSLKGKKRYLTLQVDSNENFIPGYLVDSKLSLEIADALIKPKNWNIYVDDYFAFGYGDRKFQFMIDVAPFRIDDSYFDKKFKDEDTIDMGYTNYLSGLFSEELRMLNRERLKQNMGVLREKSKTAGIPGEIVQFCLPLYVPIPYVYESDQAEADKQVTVD